MNLCANCRDNLDDDIRKEEYEELKALQILKIKRNRRV